MKVVDITSKLDLDEDPQIKVKDELITVHADAKTVLKMIGVYGDPTITEGEKSMKAYEMLIGKKDREKLDAMNISFKDLNVLIESAVNLAVGNDEDDESGETESHTTMS